MPIAWRACSRAGRRAETTARSLGTAGHSNVLFPVDHEGNGNAHLGKSGFQFQELLAGMLGTHRSSVTVAAGILQQAGLITYARGKVTIQNRAGLMDASCECYHIVHDEAVRLGLFEHSLPDCGQDRASAGL